MTEQEGRFRTVIGFVLRYGVIASFAVVALGSALLFLRGQTGYHPLVTAEELFGPQTRFVLGPGPLLRGVASGKPYAVIDLGVILLLGTPIARVIISIFLFAEERSYAFVAITATVLAILMLSVFVVAPLAAP